jgi:hypothetical protein
MGMGSLLLGPNELMQEITPMYYPDLSLYQYVQSNEDPPSLNVGWLDGTHDYPKGEPSEPFLDRLWIFCCASMQHMLGIHECELCPEGAFDRCAQRGDEELWLGSAEIRVFSREGAAYAAPNLIYHYVVDHNYCPPDEFVQAVLEGPLPDSPEYLASAEQFKWGQIAARKRRLGI